METAGREGMAPLMGSSLGQWQNPVGGADADKDDGEVTLQGGGDEDLASKHSCPTGSLEQWKMLVTSSAHWQPD